MKSSCIGLDAKKLLDTASSICSVVTNKCIGMKAFIPAHISAGSARFLVPGGASQRGSRGFATLHLCTCMSACLRRRAALCLVDCVQQAAAMLLLH